MLSSPTRLSRFGGYTALILLTVLLVNHNAFAAKNLHFPVQLFELAQDIDYDAPTPPAKSATRCSSFFPCLPPMANDVAQYIHIYMRSYREPPIFSRDALTTGDNMLLSNIKDELGLRIGQEVICLLIGPDEQRGPQEEQIKDFLFSEHRIQLPSAAMDNATRMVCLTYMGKRIIDNNALYNWCMAGKRDGSLLRGLDTAWGEQDDDTSIIPVVKHVEPFELDAMQAPSEHAHENSFDNKAMAATMVAATGATAALARRSFSGDRRAISQ